MPPHVKKDPARAKRLSRHRQLLRKAAAKGEAHPYMPWMHSVFEGRCRWCMQTEEAPIHNEDDIPELLKQAAREV